MRNEGGELTVIYLYQLMAQKRRTSLHFCIELRSICEARFVVLVDCVTQIQIAIVSIESRLNTTVALQRPLRVGGGSRGVLCQTLERLEVRIQLAAIAFLD